MCIWPDPEVHSANSEMQNRGRTKLIKQGLRKDKQRLEHLTWALDVVSKKHRRFPKPSQDRHSFICSFRTEAVHCRQTWSPCTQTNSYKFIYLMIFTFYGQFLLCSHDRCKLTITQIFPQTTLICASCPFFSKQLCEFKGPPGIWCRHCYY